MSRGDIAQHAKQVATEYLSQNRIALNLLDQRDLVTALINGLVAENATKRPAIGHRRAAGLASASTIRPPPPMLNLRSGSPCRR